MSKDLRDTHLENVADDTIRILDKMLVSPTSKRSFMLGVVKGVMLRERDKIANWVEGSKRFDNPALARDIRNDKHYAD